MHVLSDPLPFIRKAPERFLRQVPAQAHELATNLVGDAVLLTGAPATACKGPGAWWIVGCEVDWLAQGEFAATPLETFRRLLPFPEAGVNSMRSEVLLSAFAEAVITVGPEGHSEVVGEVAQSEPIWAEMEKRKQWKRAVAFRVSAPQ